MEEEPRITDHTPIIDAARADAGSEGAKFVYMTIGELWRLIHRAPTLINEEREMLSGVLKDR